MTPRTVPSARRRYRWRRVAAALFEDPERESSVRRMYDSGRRHIGI
ncbi:hypothetical protein [Streptomyces sp. NPDC048639]